MFERYTEKARRVISFARYEASQLGSPTIETEHVLLGLVREDRELARRFFGEPRTETPEAKIAEAEEHIQLLVRKMEQAIAEKDFVRARTFSDAERGEREKLRQMREALPEPFAGADGVTEEIRRKVEAAAGRREKVSTSQDLPLSRGARRVLAFGAEEAEHLGQREVGPEHLLLGLLREEGGLAAVILRERGLRLEQVREEIARSTPAQSGPGQGPGVPRPGLGIGFGVAGMGGWLSALHDAGRTLMLARQEAAQRNSACIETTDLLAALSIEKEFIERFPGAATSVLSRPKPNAVLQRERVSARDLPFSEDCQRAFTLAAQEAARLGQRTGPGHLLLGILGVESCAAAEVLPECGLTAEGIRAQLLPPPSGPEQGRSYV